MAAFKLPFTESLSRTPMAANWVSVGSTSSVGVGVGLGDDCGVLVEVTVGLAVGDPVVGEGVALVCDPR
jgi:hypothetical protein